MSEMTNNVKTWECGAKNAGDVIATLKNEILTISGNGKMRNYSDFNKAPWHNEDYVKIVVENSVKNIGSYAFSQSYGLNEVVFNNNSIVEISEGAFRYCTVLEKIEIPEGVIIIGAIAFAGCESLCFIKLPQSLSIIGDKAFFRCSSLISITIPKNVNALGKELFKYCTEFNFIINERVTPQNIEQYTFCQSDFQSRQLYVPLSAIKAYQNAPVWKNFKNILPIESMCSLNNEDVEQIEKEISTLESEIKRFKNEIIETYKKIDELQFKKSLLRGVTGNPKHVAEFMALFNQRDGLKYLTHDIDGGDDFNFENVMNGAREVCTENFESLEIPKSLKNLLNQFIFEKKPKWKSFDRQYAEIDETSGWSADGMDDVKNSALHPIKHETFKNVISNFKRLTRVESPYLETIIEKTFGNKGFELIQKDVSKADFYTHVGEFVSALETIFSEMEKRTDTDDKKKIAVSYKRETSGDFFVRKIVITHLNSYPTRNDKDALLKEWISFEKGSMAKIAEHLQGYCHWSVETKVDGEPVRVNILREKETEPYEYTDFENVDGFTHILTFYYQS